MYREPADFSLRTPRRRDSPLPALPQQLTRFQAGLARETRDSDARLPKGLLKQRTAGISHPFGQQAHDGMFETT